MLGNLSQVFKIKNLCHNIQGVRIIIVSTKYNGLEQ